MRLAKVFADGRERLRYLEPVLNKNVSFSCVKYDTTLRVDKSFNIEAYAPPIIEINKITRLTLRSYPNYS